MDASAARAIELVSLLRRGVPEARTQSLFVESGSSQVDVWCGDAHCQVVFRGAEIAAMDVGGAWGGEYHVAAPVALDLASVSAAFDFVAQVFRRQTERCGKMPA